MKRPLVTPDGFFDEAVRYYRNAKGILRRVSIRNDLYKDPKPVSEACATAYKAVLYALGGHLVRSGWDPKELPHTFAGYVEAVRRNAQTNGRVLGTIQKAYQGLHVAGYYRDISRADYIKLAFGDARWIIERLSGRKV